MPPWEHTAHALLPSWCGSVSPPRGEGPSSRGHTRASATPRLSDSYHRQRHLGLDGEQLAGVHRARRRSARTFRHFAEALNLVSVRHLPAADAATLLDGFGLTTPAAAPVVAQSAAVDAYALTTGRVVGTVAAWWRWPACSSVGWALPAPLVASATAGEGGPSWPSWRGRPVWSSADCGGRRRGWSRHRLRDRRRLAGLTRDLIPAKRGAACRAWRAVRACPACRWPPSGRRARR